MIGDGDGDTILKDGASIVRAGDGISKDGESELGERRLVEDMVIGTGSMVEKSTERVSYSTALTDDLNLVGAEQQVEIKSADKWALVTTKNGGAPLPVRGIEGCFSPNGFQLLQDMREEGEIDEAEEVEEDGSEVEEEEVNLEECVESAVGEGQVAGTQEAHNKVKMLADSIEDDERNAGAMATKKQSSSLWGRGRGSKRGSCSGPATEGAELNQKGFLSEALMSSIFAWNMRGFNQPRKQKVVRYWVKAAKLSIGCLLETKVKEENFTKVFDAIFPGWSCVHNYSSHRLGRIWVCWSDDVEEEVVAGNGGDWVICGKQSMDHTRRFNVALSTQEHSRYADSRMDMNAIKDFQDAVQQCDMVDLAQVGPSFTWTNCQDENPISKNLDRVMINRSWIAQFPQSYASFESSGVSDHLRMHIQLRDVPQGNMKPFKFFNNLTGHPRFLEVVAQVWNESELLYHSRSVLRKLQEKLKALKFEMRNLNRDMYGDLPGRVKQAYEEFCARQTEAMQNPQNSTFEAATDAWKHWHHISGIEEQFYYQKSRVQWLGLEDRNSRFFHKVTQSRNIRNTIRRIFTGEGSILTSQADIKREAVAHFESFLNGSTQSVPSVSHEELITIYSIWRERNDRRHNGTANFVDQLGQIIDKTMRNHIMSTKYYFKPKLQGLMQRWFMAHMP
ncbi:BnaC02g20440D [Brassica napus]|uniref:BnaC02g20440D protein n=1 Tax=Brassica napus TaxID=3708 RepID=A0A078F8T5_BRANA|nr:BnaC02g20440D [Brassica napus]